MGILGPPYCGIGATIRIGREMLCLPYAGFFIFMCICGGGGASGGGASGGGEVVIVKVVVWYRWWWFYSGGGGCGMSLCKGSTFNILVVP